jgi:hypothetical protein
MPWEKYPAPASVESGTAAQGIVPYWNKTLAPALRAAPPRGFRPIRG